MSNNTILFKINGDASGFEKAVNRSIGLSRSFAGAVGLSFGVAGMVAFTKQLIDISDKYTQLEGRLRLVTKSTQEFQAAQSGLYAIAQGTRVEYAATVDLYTRLARSTDQLGISQGDLLSITESINKALVVSGASGESAAAALMQLGQGMASGTLLGEELNSVMEQTPRLAQMIADGMGITIGQLRQYGKDGKLSAEEVTKALLSQAQTINSEFSRMPETVGQAMTKLTNVFESVVNDSNKAAGASQSLAGAIGEIATTLDKNRDGIINSFIAIANSVNWTAERVAALGNAVALFNKMRAGKVSVGDWMTADAEDAKRLLGQRRTAAQMYGLADNPRVGNDFSGLNTKSGSGAEKTPKGGAGKGGGGAATEDPIRSRIETLRQSLMTERELEDQRYVRGAEAIAAYYVKNGELTAKGNDLAIKLAEDHAKKMDEIAGVAKFDADMKAMQDRFKTEQELEAERYQSQLDSLTEFLDNKVATQQEYDDLLQKIETEHQDKLSAIEEAGLSDREKFTRSGLKSQAATIFGELADITSGVAQHNKTLFNINKAAGIANAVINTYEGVSKTLSKYPWPIAGVMAAAHLASGLAQVSAISSTQFNGGGAGAAPSVSGSTAATPVSDVSGSSGSSATSNKTITVYGLEKGSLFTGAQVAELLNDFMADGGKLNIK